MYQAQLGNQKNITSSIEDYELIFIMVNYNSKHIIKIIRRLLDSIVEIEKSIKSKLLIVDNASNDGSYEEIIEYGKKINLNFEIIRTSKNLGFAQAVNIAWHYAQRRWIFKFIAIINNDIIIIPKNIKLLLKFFEDERIAGVQGTIMQMRSHDVIDNAGLLIDSLGQTYPVCRGFPIKCSRAYTPSYLSGAFSIYRADVIKKLGRPFNIRIESYYDDKYLGLHLWNLGYKLLHIPVIVAYHLGSATYSAIKTFIKGPRWFEGIIIAETILMKKRFIIYPFLILYGFIAIFASLLTKQNYMKSFAKSIRILFAVNDDINLDKVPKIPLSRALYLMLFRFFRGVKPTEVIF